MSSNSFKSKIYNKYIKRLLIDYKKRNVDLFNILEKLGNDNIEIETSGEWNFGYAYTLVFLLPKECFENSISISNQKTISEKIKQDLNQIISESDECIEEIKFELKDEINVDTYLKDKIMSADVLNFWDKDCLKAFISYSEENLETANELKKHLLDCGISCFVARKDIKGEKYKKEIIKALSSMELMIPLISDSFNKSCWPNQEVGFAWCRGTTIISIKLDQSDPKGFISGINAIVELKKGNVNPHSEGYLKLLDWIKDKFPNHPFIKKYLFNKFLSAKNSSWVWAKEKFMEIIHLDFNDKEIEEIVREITDTKNQSWHYGGRNQLRILLLDSITPEHLKQLPEDEKDKYKYYAELLDDKILSQHTQNRYSITKPNGQTQCKIIDNQAKPFRTQKVTKEQEFEDIPF